MQFRPCIDIHNGQVKQIVGSSLMDKGDHAEENFVATKDAAYYAELYQKNGIWGGHIILLNPASSPYYEATRAQAMRALEHIQVDFRLEAVLRPKMQKNIWMRALLM